LLRDGYDAVIVLVAADDERANGVVPFEVPAKTDAMGVASLE